MFSAKPKTDWLTVLCRYSRKAKVRGAKMPRNRIDKEWTKKKINTIGTVCCCCVCARACVRACVCVTTESLRSPHWWNQVQSLFGDFIDEIKCSLFGVFTDEIKNRVSSESSLTKSNAVSLESSLMKSSAESLRRLHRWNQVQSLLGVLTGEFKCRVSSETSSMKSSAESPRSPHWWNQVQSRFGDFTDKKNQVKGLSLAHAVTPGLIRAKHFSEPQT